MNRHLTRRAMLSTIGATAAGTLIRPSAAMAQEVVELPNSPVAIAKCSNYGDDLAPAMEAMFENLGGLAQLVEGKTVNIKVNLVSVGWSRVGDLPVELTHWTHPAVIRNAVRLISKAGATRIRVMECCDDTIGSFAEHVGEAGWKVEDIVGETPNVELVNTSKPGPDNTWARIWSPQGGIVFPGYDINPLYTDCDVMVSIPKMKEHSWFGVTLSVKNCYGMTPLNIYGEGAGVNEPSTEISGTRVSVFHVGRRAPSLTAPQELDPESPRDGGYRIPRIISEIVGGRPIHLAIIDGVQSMAGGEGPWAAKARPVSPGVLLAGFNPVTTDAVGMAVMGFDPMAENGTVPFEGSDNFLKFCEQFGLGTRDLSKIEVRGTSIEEARFDFRTAGLPRPVEGTGFGFRRAAAD